MAFEQFGVEQGQDVAAEVLHRLPVRDVAEVADEVHPAPFLERIRRPHRIPANGSVKTRPSPRKSASSSRSLSETAITASAAL